MMPECVLSPLLRTTWMARATYGGRRLWRLTIPPVLLAMSLAGCAKTGSSPAITLSAPSSAVQPTHMIVVVTNDLPNPVAGSIPQDVDAVLAQELSERLGSPGVRVLVRQSLPPDSASVADALLIHCSVTHLRVGNQALRMTVGFGAGQFNMVTHTSVWDLRGASVADLLSFQSHSTTGSMPGSGLGLAFAAGSGQVIGMVGGGAGLLLDARQTARQRARQVADSISGQLRAYFQTKGWMGLAAPPQANSALSGGAPLAPPRPLSTS